MTKSLKIKTILTYIFLSVFVGLSFSANASNVVPAAMDQTSCKFTYPKGALFSEEEGSVTVLARVSATGVVENAVVSGSSGVKSLDKATVETIQQCKFKPGTVDGKTATTNVTIVYVWKLGK